VPLRFILNHIAINFSSLSHPKWPVAVALIFHDIFLRQHPTSVGWNSNPHNHGLLTVLTVSNQQLFVTPFSAHIIFDEDFDFVIIIGILVAHASPEKLLKQLRWRG